MRAVCSRRPQDSVRRMTTTGLSRERREKFHSLRERSELRVSIVRLPSCEKRTTDVVAAFYGANRFPRRPVDARPARVHNSTSRPQAYCQGSHGKRSIGHRRLAASRIVRWTAASSRSQCGLARPCAKFFAELSGRLLRFGVNRCAGAPRFRLDFVR